MKTFHEEQIEQLNKILLVVSKQPNISDILVNRILDLCDENESIDSEGNTLLHLIISNSYYDLAEKFIRSGVKPIFKNKNGETALDLLKEKLENLHGVLPGEDLDIEDFIQVVDSDIYSKIQNLVTIISSNPTYGVTDEISDGVIDRVGDGVSDEEGKERVYNEADIEIYDNICQLLADWYQEINNREDITILENQRLKNEISDKNRELGIMRGVVRNNTRMMSEHEKLKLNYRSLMEKYMHDADIIKDIATNLDEMYKEHSEINEKLDYAKRENDSDKILLEGASNESRILKNKLRLMEENYEELKYEYILEIERINKKCEKDIETIINFQKDHNKFKDNKLKMLNGIIDKLEKTSKLNEEQNNKHYGMVLDLATELGDMQDTHSFSLGMIDQVNKDLDQSLDDNEKLKKIIKDNKIVYDKLYDSFKDVKLENDELVEEYNDLQKIYGYWQVKYVELMSREYELEKRIIEKENQLSECIIKNIKLCEIFEKFEKNATDKISDLKKKNLELETNYDSLSLQHSEFVEHSTELRTGLLAECIRLGNEIRKEVCDYIDIY